MAETSLQNQTAEQASSRENVSRDNQKDSNSSNPVSVYGNTELDILTAEDLKKIDRKLERRKKAVVPDKYPPIQNIGPYFSHIVCQEAVAKHISNIIPENKCSLDEVIRPLASFLSQNNRFEDVTGKFQLLSVDNAIEIMKPNLICLLRGDYCLSGEKEYTLNDVMKTLNLEISPSRASRHRLENCPESFQSIFKIKKDSGRYKIKTQYPKLLARIINSQSSVPFWGEGKPNSANWNQNCNFWNECLGEIFSSNKVTADGCMLFYRLELLFRINTKAQLFFAQDNPEKDSSIVSPAVLGDIFFSSPLVYIPEEFFSKCIHSENYLHDLIQLSAYWFPVLYYGIKEYIHRQKLDKEEKQKKQKKLEKLEEFLSDPDLILRATYSLQQWERFDLRRGKRLEAYNKKWREFRPSFAHDRLSIRTIDDWKKMEIPERYSDKDRLFIKKIQQILR